MALFGKEAEKNVRPGETLKPQLEKTAPLAAPTGEIARPAAANAPLQGEGRAYLDKGSKVAGKLSFDGPARIDGQVEGEVNAKDTIVIGESAVLTAQIKASSVIVAGKVSGDIIATQRIEIRPSAKVLGNLTSPTLVIHEGALFEGHCAMQVETSRESKVTVFPKEEQRLVQAGGHKQA
ncbi:MAG: polymer-forming cytoskeletal protein [Candidatus Binataceae bacterium]